MAVDKNKIIAEATKLVQKGAFEKAIKTYERILQEDAKDVRVLLKVGELYQKKGDDRMAADAFKRVAETYADQGFFLKSVAVYKQVVKLDPEDVRVNERLAGLYQQLGLLSEAMGQFQVIAAAYEKAGDGARLLDALKRMVELDPENIGSVVRLGKLVPGRQPARPGARALPPGRHLPEGAQPRRRLPQGGRADRRAGPGRSLAGPRAGQHLHGQGGHQAGPLQAADLLQGRRPRRRDPQPAGAGLPGPGPGHQDGAGLQDPGRRPRAGRPARRRHQRVAPGGRAGAGRSRRGPGARRRAAGAASPRRRPRAAPAPPPVVDGGSGRPGGGRAAAPGLQPAPAGRASAPRRPSGRARAGRRGDPQAADRGRRLPEVRVDREGHGSPAHHPLDRPRDPGGAREAARPAPRRRAARRGGGDRGEGGAGRHPQGRDRPGAGVAGEAAAPRPVQRPSRRAGDRLRYHRGDPARRRRDGGGARGLGPPGHSRRAGAGRGTAPWHRRGRNWPRCRPAPAARR